MTTQKVRRSTGARGAGERLHHAQTFDTATALDLACARFALRAVATLGPRFNLRRDINNVITLAGRYFIWPEPILLRVRDFLSRRCTDMPAWAGCAKLAPEEFMTRHGAWNGLYDDTGLYYYLDEYVKLHAKDLQAVFQATVSALDQRLGKRRVRLVDNIAMLSAVLGLTDAEQSVLLHASLCKYQRDLRPVLVDCKASSAQEAYGMLAQVLGLNAAEVGAVLKPGGRLETLGLIETPVAEHAVTDLGDLMRVSDKLLAVLTADYPERIVDDGGVHTAGGQHAPDRCRLSPCRRRHALPGGVAAVGRRGWPNAASTCCSTARPAPARPNSPSWSRRQAGLELYEVDCLDKDGQQPVRQASAIARCRCRRRSCAVVRRAAVLFDEVEDVFPPISARSPACSGAKAPVAAAVNGKAWVNQTLENRTRCPRIWISNSIHQIDPAYRRGSSSTSSSRIRRRRCARASRASTCSSSACRRGVRRADRRAQGDHTGADPGGRPLRPPGPRTARRTGRVADRDPARTRADRALGNAARAASSASNVTRYDLAAERRVAAIRCRASIEALKVAAARDDCASTGCRARGKTALGEHIARSIERPLMIRRASDLMSKYVGETEQQMARMFADAQREGGGAAARRGRQLPAEPSDRPCATTRSAKSTRCSRAWSASKACSSARPTCSTASTRPRCAASRSS
jgi:hypothetical protein